MKKIFKLYLVIWAALLVAFNIVSFVSVEWAGHEKYTPSFWFGYALITIAFLGQLGCAYFALRDGQLKKTFYRLSLMSASYTGLILSFVFGGLCMLVPVLPYWLGILLCGIVLAFNVIAVVKAEAAIEVVSGIDDKSESHTVFIRTLTADAQRVAALAKSDAVKAECKKVYEAVRYSDPMSSPELSAVEEEISAKFAHFTEAVTEDNVEKAVAVAEEVLLLVGERNRKCRLLK